jgi:hypothetical protein
MSFQNACRFAGPPSLAIFFAELPKNLVLCTINGRGERRNRKVFARPSSASLCIAWLAGRLLLRQPLNCGQVCAAERFTSLAGLQGFTITVKHQNKQTDFLGGSGWTLNIIGFDARSRRF